MDRVQKAVELFEKGCNCSQSVLCAFAEDFQLDAGAAMKLASGFGGGVGRMGSLCGALSGALMVLGLRYAGTEIGDKSAKMENYRRMRNLAEEFKMRAGAMDCRDLLGFDMGKPEGELASQKPGAFHNCPGYVKVAAEILEEMI